MARVRQTTASRRDRPRPGHSPEAVRFLKAFIVVRGRAPVALSAHFLQALAPMTPTQVVDAELRRRGYPGEFSARDVEDKDWFAVRVLWHVLGDRYAAEYLRMRLACTDLLVEGAYFRVAMYLKHNRNNSSLLVERYSLASAAPRPPITNAMLRDAAFRTRGVRT
eukprot:jgi/Tetstr1/454281/TSEL_041200.t1